MPFKSDLMAFLVHRNSIAILPFRSSCFCCIETCKTFAVHLGGFTDICTVPAERLPAPESFITQLPCSDCCDCPPRPSPPLFSSSFRDHLLPHHILSAAPAWPTEWSAALIRTLELFLFYSDNLCSSPSPSLGA